MSNKALIIAGLVIIAALELVAAEDGIDTETCKSVALGDCYGCCRGNSMTWRWNNGVMAYNLRGGTCECEVPLELVGFTDKVCSKIGSERDCEVCCRVVGAKSKIITTLTGVKECRCSNKKKKNPEIGIFSTKLAMNKQ